MAEKALDPVLVTERFMLRPLTPKDANHRYLGWLSDEGARRYIQAARETPTLDGLRDYIAGRAGKSDVLFLGIFERLKDTHVGNIKYEPINTASGSAEMGILIGDPEWRGRGVACEVIAATTLWLRAHRGITHINLGVERDNVAALAAYIRAGFQQTGVMQDSRVEGDILRMMLRLSDKDSAPDPL